MAERVFAYADSGLTQQAEIRRRLADPNPTYAPPKKVREFFSRFGVRSA